MIKRLSSAESIMGTLSERLHEVPRTWLVTGAAGFIGSHLVETLLRSRQDVVGLDNFATGSRANLEQIEKVVGFDRFRFIEGDIRDLQTCRLAMRGVTHVLHQAALGSVPRSLEDPATTNAVNVGGFVNILLAAKDAGVTSFVYASSSSVYGDDNGLPKVEGRVGRPLSPYAASKLVNEIYADTFRTSFGFASIGLRYFNVFGPRQDPQGAYAAVIPRWINSALSGDRVRINGDASISRDFCYVANAVQANLLAALAAPEVRGNVLNVACATRTTLSSLHAKIVQQLERININYKKEPVIGDLRPGDVKHSLADITKIQNLLGYSPTHSVDYGLEETVLWYVGRHNTLRA